MSGIRKGVGVMLKELMAYFDKIEIIPDGKNLSINIIGYCNIEGASKYIQACFLKEELSDEVESEIVELLIGEIIDLRKQAKEREGGRI